jgi:predicted signal transduction protein with EAL and GGDEF domain
MFATLGDGDRAVAQVLKANSKGCDVAVRYGGEEFALLLPQTPVAGALALAQHIRATIEKAQIRRQDSEHIVGNITYRPASACISLERLQTRCRPSIFEAHTTSRSSRGQIPPDALVSEALHLSSAEVPLTRLSSIPDTVRSPARSPQDATELVRNITATAECLLQILIY